MIRRQRCVDMQSGDIPKKQRLAFQTSPALPNHSYLWISSLCTSTQLASTVHKLFVRKATEGQAQTESAEFILVFWILNSVESSTGLLVAGSKIKWAKFPLSTNRFSKPFVLCGVAWAYPSISSCRQGKTLERWLVHHRVKFVKMCDKLIVKDANIL